MKYGLLVCMLFIYGYGYSQRSAIDSLDKLIASAKSDTQRIRLSNEKLYSLGSVNIDSAISFGKKIIIEADKIGYNVGKAAIMARISNYYSYNGNFAEAREHLQNASAILEGTDNLSELSILNTGYGIFYGIQNKYDSAQIYFQRSLEIGEKTGNRKLISASIQNIAVGYYMQSSFGMAVQYQQRALKIYEEDGNISGQATLLVNMGNAYSSAEDTVRAKEAYMKAIGFAQKSGQPIPELYAYKNLANLIDKEGFTDSALAYSIKASELARKTGDRGIESAALAQTALFLGKKGNYAEAEEIAKKGIAIADSIGVPFNIFQTYSSMGSIYHYQKQYHPAIAYFKTGFSQLEETHLYTYDVAQNYLVFSDCYEKIGDFKNSLEAHKKYADIMDSVRRKSNIRKVTELSMGYDFAQKEQETKLEQEKKLAQKNAQQLALIVGLASAIILAIIAFLAFRNKQRANTLLNEQKQEIEETLSKLRATQTQLIQSEKMASLGELTAGIAHEIQNPLNFVNNFSDLNTELIEELKEELAAGRTTEAIVIADDIFANEKKINHHGKRAEAIVRGMLQHSRSNTGNKDLTNINGLTDEYLRLAYHGLRAKDKSFNATLKTDYDSAIGNIMINAQDIGRVILNLITNAFYAVNEKRGDAIEGYDPTVSVQTRLINHAIEIRVNDNGNGIPARVVDKIFQPFFTTKPAGQGTGLGLSLSYDIIKAHHGELTVQTEEGEGTTFLIHLPLDTEEADKI